MAVCLERAVLFAYLFYAVLIVRVPFPFGVWDRMWNSIVSIPEHCLCIYFDTTPERRADFRASQIFSIVILILGPLSKSNDFKNQACKIHISVVH